MTEKIITKSRFLQGLRCRNLLWNIYSDPSAIEEDPQAKMKLNPQYRQMMSLFRSAFPGGTEIREGLSYEEGRRITQERLKTEKILFNAVFLENDCFSRIDVLEKSGDVWNIYEVRSTVRNRTDSYIDTAFQKKTVEASGIKTGNCFIVLINPAYILGETFEIENFFKIKNVTVETDKAVPHMESLLKKVKITAALSEFPPRNEESCRSPKDCRSREKCWKGVELGDIFSLREGREISIQLFNAGIRYMKDIPPETDLNTAQKIQISSYLENRPFINKEKIQDFINKVKYPASFLDFETVNPSIPIFAKTAPYQHVPFLFSLHILEEDKSITHKTWISRNHGDPREEILKSLKEWIPEGSGSIICFNDMIERKCLKDSAAVYTEYQNWVQTVLLRFQDISNVFRNFQYYHPMQNGSASLKSIYPALTGEPGYGELTIKDGGSANLEYLLFLLQEKEADPKLLSDLEKYCSMDTYAMVRIFIKLQDFLLE